MAVRSQDFERVWFIAAEIDGPGIEDEGEVGIWATNADPDGSSLGTVFAVNGFAQEFSTWPAGDSTDAAITEDDHGAEEARDCLG